MLNYILLAVFLAIAVAGFLLRRSADKRYAQEQTKRTKRMRMLSLVPMVLGLYFAVGRVLELIFGAHPAEGMGDYSPWGERMELFGFDISQTVVYTWVIMAVLVVIAIILRLTVLRRLAEKPQGAQNVLEFMVETAMDYAGSNVHGEGEMLGSYIFAIVALLVGCAFTELLGIRTPASDLSFTLGMGLVTFVLINIYGIKKKGVVGRLKSLANPTPFILPIKIITDLAIPVSLAARLFGNMLGGMIIMHLIYMALGNNGTGLPAVAGLYFSVFHPILQAFIFITLSLTFIREAVE